MAAVTADAAWAERWLREIACAVTARREELCDLDRAIGDGDHGDNLVRGFSATLERLADTTRGRETVGDVLVTAATTVMSTVGGAAGPLYGTAFLRAAKVSGAPVLDPFGVVALVEAMLEGVATRGRAEPGEKTMVDALAPAAHAAGRSADLGGDVLAVLEAAAGAARDGAEATRDLVATKGRASYLVERSRGHLDPGAVSAALVLEAAVRAMTSGATEVSAGGGDAPAGSSTRGAAG